MCGQGLKHAPVTCCFTQVFLVPLDCAAAQAEVQRS